MEKTLYDSLFLVLEFGGVKRERPKREMLCKRCMRCEQGEGVARVGLVPGEIVKLFLLLPADLPVPGGVPRGVPVPVGVPREM